MTIDPPELEDYRYVDGRKIKVAKFITNRRTGRISLDAPYGYPKKIDLGSGVKDPCFVYDMTDVNNDSVRYAVVEKPPSDPLVMCRVRRI